MSTPSQLPRTAVRLSPERAAQLDALATERGLSFAKLVGSIVAATIQADGWAQAIREYQEQPAIERPVRRMFRLGPNMKILVSDAAWKNRVSKSVALDAAIAFVLARLEGHSFEAWAAQKSAGSQG